MTTIETRSVLCLLCACALAGATWSCGGSSSGDDGAVTGFPAGHSAAFRGTLANPAPAEYAEGERLYYEDAFGGELHGGWPPARFMVDLWKSDVARWGEQFSAYGWLVDPGDDLPVGLKRGSHDRTAVHETCAACHVARLDDGRLWSGMPATSLRMSPFRLAIDDAWVAAGHPSQLTALEREKLLVIREPGIAGVESSADPRAVPGDFPLYQNLGLRDNLGATGGAHDVRSVVWISMFGFGAGKDDVPFPGPEITDPFDAFMAWMTTPPPLQTDATRAARGREVFAEAQCNACHHPDNLQADEVVTWTDGPELLPGQDAAHPHGTIATDRTFASLGDSTGDGGFGPETLKIIQFIFEHQLDFAATDGYVTMDLHAAFATAPYLHNGSVPTLADLLRPAAERPTTFTVRGYPVDTTVPGFGNRGHEFGTTLSAEDKDALVAYLNSL